MQAVPVYDLEYTKVTTSPKEKSVKEFINSLTFVGSGTKEDPYVCEGQTLNLDSYDLVKIIEDTDRPEQFLFAGKAHPADERGKEIIQ